MGIKIPDGGGRRSHTQHHPITARMISALIRWAAMKAIIFVVSLMQTVVCVWGGGEGCVCVCVCGGGG